MAPVCGAQGVDALDVVVVVMGDQDVGQPPLVRLQRGEDRAGFGHVDHGGLAGGGIVDQVGVVVGQAGDGHKFKRHGLWPFAGYDGAGLTRRAADRNAP